MAHTVMMRAPNISEHRLLAYVRLAAKLVILINRGKRKEESTRPIGGEHCTQVRVLFMSGNELTHPEANKEL